MKLPSAVISRRVLLTTLLAGGAQCALANAPQASLRPTPRPGPAPQTASLPATRPRRRPAPPEPPGLAELLRQARLGDRAEVGFVVADAETGQVIEARNPRTALPPASVNKAVTALYALQTLGPSHSFRTRLLATGPLNAGRLEGDLVLAGAGDPTLDTDALFDLVARAKEAGLREVTGRFLIWDGALPRIPAIDPGQPDHVGYNPAVGGLNLNFNRVHFEWRREASGWTTTMDARTATHRPRVGMARMSIVDREGPVYTYQKGSGVDQWTVARRALGNGGSRWLPVRHPALYCAEVFAKLARSHGITLKAPERVTGLPGGVTLAEHFSAPLSEITRGMLKFSTNLTAEVLGLAASAARGQPPAGLVPSAQAMGAWLRRGIRSPGPRLVDHSGLGDQSRLTAEDMVAALVRLGPRSDLAAFMPSHAVRGADGGRIEGHPATVLAKTGTLNFVSALAGYVDLRGRRLAFATFTADTARRAGIARENREAPTGARAWARRSRLLQLRLVDRWSQLV